MQHKSIPVWDLAVRLFHWTLVVGFTIAYLSGEQEGLLHAYSGYVVLGLILFRVLWGVIGSTHARFSDFLVAPRKVGTYLRSLRSGKPRHYSGHNPAGGWMIILMLLSLLVTTLSGVQVYGLEGHGPLAAQAATNASAEDFWEEIHEVAANFTVFLIIVHLLGVAVSSLVHRENLVRAMFTGKKVVSVTEPAAAVHSAGA